MAAEKDDSNVVVSGGDEAAARRSGPFRSDGTGVDVPAFGDCNDCGDGDAPDGGSEGA